MPLYEYECGSCGTFEVIQRFSDPPLTRCPKCAGRVQKLLSAPAIQFKGTGWYITDYARKGSGEGKKTGDDKKTIEGKTGETAPAEAASSSSTESAASSKDKGVSSGRAPEKKR